ncbi:MAG TPA: hypothetical protein VIM51_07800 [Desulfosporosinus sp.]
METYIAGLGLQQILIIGVLILVVGFIVKKLFKLAITIAIILALVYYGLPLLQSLVPK